LAFVLMDYVGGIRTPAGRDAGPNLTGQARPPLQGSATNNSILLAFGKRKSCRMWCVKTLYTSIRAL
jgi:hypothetical protein